MLEKLLTAWTSYVIRQAVPMLLTLVTLTTAAGWYAVSAFKMNSDTSELVRQDTDWRRTYNDYLATFPQYSQNTFAVVSGARPNEVREVTLALRDELQGKFSSVYAPGIAEFADRNTLLFVDIDRLDQILVRLADAQPFLTAIAQDASLRGPLNLLSDAFNSGEDLPEALNQMAEPLNLAAEQALAGNASPLSWRDEIFRVGGTGTFYQIIVVQGNRDFDVQLPNREMIAGMRQAISNLDHPYKDRVKIRLSGQVALDHEEIESAVDGAQFTGTLALLILAFVLLAGVRSLSIIAATYLSMLIGLVWTGAFAMLAVGQYNTISIIFLVLFIGLGVDFAIHLCLRYQEATMTQDKTAALVDTSRSLGAAIILCGITAAVGFLSFTPTEYRGVAELGIISGGGMIIGVLVTLTLIPAYFAVMPKPPAPLPFSPRFTRPLQHKQLSLATLVLGVALSIIGTQAHFDHSTLAIKNPESEAMTTLNELIAEGIITDYTLTWVAPNEQAALDAKLALSELEVVAEVQTPVDYLPADQEEKLLMLDDASIMLSTLLEGPENARSDDRAGGMSAGADSNMGAGMGNDMNVGTSGDRPGGNADGQDNGIAGDRPGGDADGQDNGIAGDRPGGNADGQDNGIAGDKHDNRGELLPDDELVRLLSNLADDMAARLSQDTSPALTQLANNLRALAAAPESARQLMHQLVMPPIQAEIAWLRQALQAEPLELNDLPDDLKARLVTEDGRQLVSIAPSGSLVSAESLRHFTDEVLAITPGATGRPVLDLGISEIVLRSFAIALVLAVTIIFIILLLTLRNVVDALLVFIPLYMTAMVTLTFSVLAGLPLNMANIVVLPLIFGLGVGNGIHVVKRFRQSSDPGTFSLSSTPRAVFLSNLTTLGTFCTLSISPHQGISSIGILLTVALSSLLLLTLIALPALLETFSRPTD